MQGLKDFLENLDYNIDQFKALNYDYTPLKSVYKDIINSNIFSSSLFNLTIATLIDNCLIKEINNSLPDCVIESITKIPASILYQDEYINHDFTLSKLHEGTFNLLDRSIANAFDQAFG